MCISLQLNNQLSAVCVGLAVWKGSSLQVGGFKNHKNAVRSAFRK